MIHFLRTDASNPDFMYLVKKLDTFLAIIDGADHQFYHQYNGILDLPHILVGYVNDIPVACGAIKTFNTNTMEVKRMFVSSEYRGKGYASALLIELENWAKELGATKCILETGKKMQDAIALYKKNNYYNIPNYGQYIGVDNSVCMEKLL